MTKNDQAKKKLRYEFLIKNERPEEFAKDPAVYYTPERVKEYANSKALMMIQEKITQRALDIARMTPPATVLDLGMGCGFATAYLLLKKYRPVGVDLNWLFLSCYNTPDLNPIQGDMRNIQFRPQSFDFIISISAVQWILAEPNQQKRQKALISLVDVCSTAIKLGGKIVFQFYPKNDDIMHEVGSVFNATGKYEGNFVIDNVDNPKKRRIFLYLEKIQN